MLATSASFANNDETIKTVRPDGVVIEQVVVKNNNDTLYCSVTWPDGTKYECWLCKCNDLPRPTLL